MLPATGLVITALATFGIVHPPVETCNRVLSNVIESSGLQSCLVSPNYHYVSVQDGDRIVLNEVCGIGSSRAFMLAFSSVHASMNLCMNRTSVRV